MLKLYTFVTLCILYIKKLFVACLAQVASFLSAVIYTLCFLHYLQTFCLLHLVSRSGQPDVLTRCIQLATAGIQRYAAFEHKGFI